MSSSRPRSGKPDTPPLTRAASFSCWMGREPRPPWAEDLRFLVSYLAYSAFLNRVDLGHIRKHYDELLATTPELFDWSSNRR